MPLTEGTRLGPYEVIAAIGAGGMGEVYKAKDTRLDRTVAIKVLLSHLADNPERKQRFEREARAVSSLNHPHICTLHDIGEQDGTAFLVMEHIDGQTLADRLKKGALPLDQALRHAIEIADALDKAHRQGVVHRDLKPGNIMLTKSGAKLLDFGLAKLKVSEPGQERSVSSALPTEEKPLTEKGAILGTFQFMAPEQLEGMDADSRTDIFAFGAVLYEMLTGRRAFEGKSQASLISAIMKDDPPVLSTLLPKTPRTLEWTVSKCLAKEPNKRWQSAQDLHDELKFIAEGGSETGVPVAARPMRHTYFAWGLALVLAVVVAGMAAWDLKLPSPSLRPPMRFGITLPADQQLMGTMGTGRHVLALSPDGSHLVYAANNQLYMRSMDQMEATPIRGTEDARNPIFSPERQWVGFWASGKLKKVSVSGGAPVTLCDAGGLFGASWGPDDTIVFGQSPGGILRVSGQGGTPEVLVQMDASKEEYGHGPQILPGGKTILFTLADGTRNWDEAQIVMQSLETGERRVLVKEGSDARYAPTGHLVYALGATLYAVPFDLERLEVTGGPVPVVEDVMRSSSNTGAAQFSFANNGSLAYVSSVALENTLVWVDRKGYATPLVDGMGMLDVPRLSPDRTRIAFRGGGDIWILDVERATRTRLTFDGATEPVFTPDSTRVTYYSISRNRIEWKQADGTGDAETLRTGEHPAYPQSWSPDGNVLAFYENKNGQRDIWTLHLGGDQTPTPFVETPFNEHSPMFSPDGRWLAYVSDESGREEIWVQPYSGLRGKYLLSTDGGREPLWSVDGRELFYRNGDQVLAVAIKTRPTFKAETPHVLFEEQYVAGSSVAGGNRYDVSTDGQRFVMIRGGQVPALTQLNIVLNWFQELKRLVPTN